MYLGTPVNDKFLIIKIQIKIITWYLSFVLGILRRIYSLINVIQSLQIVPKFHVEMWVLE